MSESLLQRVADTTAVAQCVNQFGGLVWSLARRLVRASDAEDAVQEVFIELWKKAAAFDPAIASETTFVAMVARRRLIDRRRRDLRRREGEAVPIDDLPIAALEAPNPTDLRDEAARAAEVLELLKPEQRMVLKLAVCQGWPHQLIADRLGIPLGTVKTYVGRGLARIRGELRAESSTGGREATG